MKKWASNERANQRATDNDDKSLGSSSNASSMMLHKRAASKLRAASQRFRAGRSATMTMQSCATCQQLRADCQCQTIPQSTTTLVAQDRQPSLASTTTNEQSPATTPTSSTTNDQDTPVLTLCCGRHDCKTQNCDHKLIRSKRAVSALRRRTTSSKVRCRRSDKTLFPSKRSHRSSLLSSSCSGDLEDVMDALECYYSNPPTTTYFHPQQQGSFMPTTTTNNNAAAAATATPPTTVLLRKQTSESEPNPDVKRLTKDADYYDRRNSTKIPCCVYISEPQEAAFQQVIS